VPTGYGQRGRTVNLQYNSGVYICTDQPLKGAGIGAADKARRVFLALLRLSNAQGANVSANPTASKNYAPTMFAAHQKSENVGRKAFETAMCQEARTHPPITRTWLIAQLREVAVEATKHGDLAWAEEALELAWLIALSEWENRTLH
jgi:hypothetical protein